MKRLLSVIVIVAALAGLFAFGLLRGAPDRIIDSNLMGRSVPAFSLPVHANLLSEYGASFGMPHTGQPVILNFWAEWCEPCRTEAPLLEDVWQKYGDQVLVLGVQTQDKGRQAAGRAFIHEFGLTFPNVYDDDSRVGISYGIFGLPETFFIRADGTLQYKHAGILTAELLENQIEALLN